MAILVNSHEYAMEEDTTLFINSIEGVLNGATDETGQTIDISTLTAQLVDPTTNGTVNILQTGSFEYVPNRDFNGTDTFTFTATDGTNTSNIGTVTINVANVVEPIIANNDSYTMQEDQSLTVHAPGVISNDTVGESPVTAVLMGRPTNGQVNFYDDGSFTYVPNPDYFGSDFFTYRITDGMQNSNEATVTITIEDVIDPPENPMEHGRTEEGSGVGFHGFDISSYQTITNPDKFFADADFVYFRAYGSEHRYGGDTSFVEFCRLADQYNVPSGAYYFGTPKGGVNIYQDAEAQAEQFIQKLYEGYGTGNLGELLPMLDVEEYTDVVTGQTGMPMSSGLSSAHLVVFIKTFREYIFNKTGRVVGLYAGRYFLEDQMKLTEAEMMQLSTIPLWFAEYDRWYPANAVYPPEVFGGWNDFNVWQYEVVADADTHGISSNLNELDHNYTYDLDAIRVPPSPQILGIEQHSNTEITITFTEPSVYDYVGTEIYINGTIVGTLSDGVNSFDADISIPVGDRFQVNVVSVDAWGDKGWSSNAYHTVEDIEQIAPPPDSSLPVAKHRLIIFNREEEIVTTLEQENKETASFYNGRIKHVLNGEHVLTFTVPVTHPDAWKVEEMGYVAVKNKYRQWELFEITEIYDVHSDEAVIEREITAEGAYVELNNTFIENQHHDRKRPAVVLPQLLKDTRWEAGVIVGDELHDLTVKRKSVLEGLQRFRDRWNGELIYRVEIVGNRIAKRVIDFVPQKGAWKGKRFVYGEDLIEITRTVDSRNVKTAVYVYGPAAEGSNTQGIVMDISEIEWSVANGDPVDKPLGQNWLGDPEALEKWGKPIGNTGERQHLFGVYENREAVDDIDLIWKAWTYGLPQLKNPLLSYTAKVVDLYQLYGLESESVDLGDTVATLDKDLGISLSARIVEYNMDLDNPENDDLTIGNYLPNYTSDSGILDQVTEQIDEIVENTVQKGEPINPSWLETEFEFASDAIRLGGGTVIMNRNDGILIVDDPVNPQKAIKLNAGQIALANSRDITTNTFNWRAFGTGDGFLSDIVETGFLRFERSQGGVLSLGGSGNGNGQLIVYDENGNVIGDLDATKGGFTSLYVGQFTADNVLNSNSEVIVLIVNPVTGNDNYDGLTSYRPLRRLQEAIDRIPKHNNGRVEIYIENESELNEDVVRIDGFFGSGSINIYFHDSIIQGMLYVEANVQRIELRNGFVNQIYGTKFLRDGTVTVSRSNDVYFHQMGVYSRRNVDFGIKVRYGSNVHIESSNFYDNTTAGVRAEYGGTVDMTGNNYGSGGFSGLSVLGTGRIAVHGGTAPAGTSLGIERIDGGEVVGDVAGHNVGTPLILPAPPITTYFEAEAIRSWNSRNGWNYNNQYIYQGEWSEFSGPYGQRVYYGNYKGCFFFNNQAITTAIEGRTVLNARIALKRLSYGGYSGSYTANLWMLYNSRSILGVQGEEPWTDQSVTLDTAYSWGEYDYIQIPIWVLQTLANGSYDGFALYEPSGANYMIFESFAQLEITYK